MSDPIITDLSQVAQRAQAEQDAFLVMQYQLELDDELSDAQIDAYVSAIEAQVLQVVDCTQCGNCCKALTVHLYPEDMPRLAQATLIPLGEIETRFVEHPAELPEDVWGQFKTSPCVFLQQTRCSIYAHRPSACRDFPTFTPDFRWTLDYLIDNASLCPIIYNVLHAMCSGVDELQRKSAQNG